MLKNKTILIISPQNWDSIKLSKHHYALTLSKLNNCVYFLNPIKSGFYSKITKNEGVNVIDFKIPLPYFLKFKFNYLFNQLLSQYFNIWIKIKNLKFDIIWDFDNTLQFNNYSIFKNAIKIWHPVDPAKLNFTNHKNPDIIFSVSKLILDSQKIDCPKYFINHGLADIFVRQAIKNLENFQTIAKIQKVGYCGNLDIKNLNSDILIKLINKYPHINFYFIGPYSNSGNLYKILKDKPNVIFTGTLYNSELVQKINQMDVLLYNYINDYKSYFGDNSHKVVEYLSTGKIILGTELLAYKDKHDLIIQVNNDDEFISKFDEIVNNTHKFYNKDIYSRKIKFAIANSYENHIINIEKILIQNKLI